MSTLCLGRQRACRDAPVVAVERAARLEIIICSWRQCMMSTTPNRPVAGCTDSLRVPEMCPERFCPGRATWMKKVTPARAQPCINSSSSARAARAASQRERLLRRAGCHTGASACAAVRPMLSCAAGAGARGPAPNQISRGRPAPGSLRAGEMAGVAASRARSCASAAESSASSSTPSPSPHHVCIQNNKCVSPAPGVILAAELVLALQADPSLPHAPHAR